MTDQVLKARITDAMKTAMKAREKPRLSAIRLILSELKRIEVDERIDIDDARVLVVLDKMCKQRRDSTEQYQAAGRNELADVEIFEISVIQDFLPTQLSAEELDVMISAAIEQTAAESMKDMGKVMAILKPQLQGRADMGEVSKQIKSSLS
jgi:uncharacterized protein YqeY